MSTYFEKITTPWPLRGGGGGGVNPSGQSDRFFPVLFFYPSPYVFHCSCHQMTDPNPACNQHPAETPRFVYTHTTYFISHLDGSVGRDCLLLLPIGEVQVNTPLSHLLPLPLSFSFSHLWGCMRVTNPPTFWPPLPGISCFEKRWQKVLCTWSM